MLTVLISVAATLFVVFFALNLTTGEKRVKKQIRHLYSIHDAQFQRTMGVLLGPVIVSGNRFETLENGDAIFPSMLQAIRSAQKTISFETYIYWSGEIGKTFADALSQRARAGVKVHVLLDWLGSKKMDDDFLSEMRDAGVEVRRYHAPRWYNLYKLNNRTHRKILVVDGRVGHTGGVGIATEWGGHAQDPQHWRDSHFRAEGPVVAQMQSVFGDNWVKATGNVLDGDDYFPALAPVGDAAAQMFASSPSGGSEGMEIMYLLMIAAAERSIELSSAYFVPDELARATLVAALQRGVRVRIIAPGPHIDKETVRHASRALWGDLLQAGAEIYEYQPTMFHCKVLIADGLLVSVGSTNFDARSFHLNDEASLNIYDEAFAAHQIEVFERDLKSSRRISYDQWRNRPWLEKLWGHAAALLGPQI
ncbi:MAG: phospholipase D-like domain-containing protein [Gemmatimonadota bacterium]|nr:phospholipase D-like domain-containing protein [Gemmatimonadota bacterium]